MNEYVEICRRFYLRRPETVTNIEDIAKYDKEITADIAELEKTIERLKGMRIALSARYGELSTMNYKTEVKLSRRHGYDNRIYYDLVVTKVFDDGTTCRSRNTAFSGKDRRIAIEEYNKAVNERNGCTAILDIAKRSWER